ncbi:tripartite tricarboxylate transporter substrate binding protein [Variovorax paradoxus]|uniref:Bug family tripartite tricarboxylate transporter substrate binding protein n=1 Tax=Variovorax paradoxus TaxID=34073 RepID=UPI00056DCAD9|nr:tripartite tricarboxylate transporter substrate binding protein [Variovorax paradoxus]
MKRRSLISLAAAVAATPILGSAQPKSWPNGPVRIVVPFAPGGGSTPPLAHMLADELTKVFGSNFLVEYKPGANGNIGAVYVKKSPPDGSAFLFTGAGTMATNPALYKNPGFDPKADFEPVILYATMPNVLVVNQTIPATTVKEFADYLRSTKEHLAYGSSGNGSSMHTAGALFLQATGTSMTHVPYNSAGAATTDLIGNNIQVMFQLVPGIAQFVKAKQVKALAVMAAQRSPMLPDVPTMAEAGFPALESNTWLCLVAPRGTPREIVQRMNEAVNKVLAQPSVRERIAQLGAQPLGGTPAEFASYLDSEMKKWGAVVRKTGLSVE